jgi:DNA-directed RNA polymerase specialized sigma24 family protein
MVNTVQIIEHDMDDPRSDSVWRELYPSLLSFARSLVFSFRVSSWRGQEEDIVQDIVQETTRRLIERLQKAERGERTQVQSLQAMMFTIAQNYCRDLRRRDIRLTRIDFDDPTASWNGEDDQTCLVDVAIENAFLESLFLLIAWEIARFPPKLGQALLIDLVSRMSFDAEPTKLQEAFLKVGIQLRDYQNCVPHQPRDRRNHAALLYYAYKRIAQLPSVQEYSVEACL